MANFTITQPPNRQGIYGDNWNYAGQSQSKASTMFPDNCQQIQVLNSIIYAATHPTSCPVNSPSWANCGHNKPKSGKGNYCEAKDKSVFSIAFSFLNNDSNKVNTAFPLRN